MPTGNRTGSLSALKWDISITQETSILCSLEWKLFQTPTRHSSFMVTRLSKSLGTFGELPNPEMSYRMRSYMYRTSTGCSQKLRAHMFNMTWARRPVAGYKKSKKIMIISTWSRLPKQRIRSTKLGLVEACGPQVLTAMLCPLYISLMGRLFVCTLWTRLFFFFFFTKNVNVLCAPIVSSAEASGVYVMILVTLVRKCFILGPHWVIFPHPQVCRTCPLSRRAASTPCWPEFWDLQ